MLSLNSVRRPSPAWLQLVLAHSGRDKAQGEGAVPRLLGLPVVATRSTFDSLSTSGRWRRGQPFERGSQHWELPSQARGPPQRARMRRSCPIRPIAVQWLSAPESGDGFDELSEASAFLPAWLGRSAV